MTSSPISRTLAVSGSYFRPLWPASPVGIAGLGELNPVRTDQSRDFLITVGDGPHEISFGLQRAHDERNVIGMSNARLFATPRLRERK